MLFIIFTVNVAVPDKLGVPTNYKEININKLKIRYIVNVFFNFPHYYRSSSKKRPENTKKNLNILI